MSISLEQLQADLAARDAELARLSDSVERVGAANDQLVVECDRLRAQLASAEAEQSKIYQRVSRMTTLEGEARELGGVMAMLDEISERCIAERGALEAAEARVRELEDALRKAESVRALYEDAEARLRAVTDLLPDAYAEESKDWKAGDACERIRWLRCMYEAKTREADLYLEQLEQAGERLRAVTEAGRYLRDSLDAQVNRRTRAYDPDADRAAIARWDAARTQAGKEGV